MFLSGGWEMAGNDKEPFFYFNNQPKIEWLRGWSWNTSNPVSVTFDPLNHPYFMPAKRSKTGSMTRATRWGNKGEKIASTFPKGAKTGCLCEINPGQIQVKFNHPVFCVDEIVRDIKLKKMSHYVTHFLNRWRSMRKKELIRKMKTVWRLTLWAPRYEREFRTFEFPASNHCSPLIGRAHQSLESSANHSHCYCPKGI